MSDLIERLERWGRDEGLQNHFIGSRSARKDCAEAATALAEAQAEIARLRDALITWRNSFETKRNEPLQIAYEIGNEALGVPTEQSKREASALFRPHATKGEAG